MGGSRTQFKRKTKNKAVVYLKWVMLKVQCWCVERLNDQ